MTSSSLHHLFQADTTLFINLQRLNFLRFEGENDSELVANLVFSDGASETVRGEAARKMYEQLTGIERDVLETPPIAESVAQQTTTQTTTQQPAHSYELDNLDFTVTSSGPNKAWFYRKDNGRGLILAFVNAKGSCSVRPFDADRNIALGKRYGSGDYQENFANLLKGATELFVDTQPNLERDCKQRLPDRLFSYLRKQIDQINEA